ncbi:MAG: FAD-dependent oxidoreductase [Paracoccaceae bacterium]
MNMILPVSPRTVLIIGAGQAGGQAARQLLAEGFDGRIVVAGAEMHPPYERPPLSKAVLKDAAAESAIAIVSPEEWRDPRIDFRAGDPVVSLDAEGAQARLQSGAAVGFDVCLIATGGDARILPIPGAEFCRNLRTLDDSRALRAELTPGRRLVIIGGGVIGCEVAATAATLGCKVTIVEAGQRLMARILPPVVSDWLAEWHARAGVDIVTGARLHAIEQASGALVVTGENPDGTALRLDSDLVLSAIGMAPNAELVADERRGPTGGILTDACGRVIGSDRLFALGDVAESWSPLYGRHLRLETWRNADKQARAIARTLCGTETPHAETPWMWTDQLDRNIQVVGLWSEGAEVICRGPVGEPGSAVFWLQDGMLCGGALIDAGRDRRFLEKLVETAATPSAADLANPSLPLKNLAR